MSYYEAMQYLEDELKASAAAFPGANEDLTTYVRIDLLKQNPRRMIELFEKETRAKTT